MNIISQDYENELVNFIKNKILEKIIETSSSFVYNILHFSNNKYLNWVSDLDYNLRQLFIDILQEAIKFIDDKFRNSEERKKRYHVNIKEDIRNLRIASIGEITITRTYYETKDRKEHFYFIDQLLGLNKFERYDSFFKATTINLAMKTNQKLGGELIGEMYSDMKDLLSEKDNSISRQTVFNWVKNWNVPKIIYAPIDIDGDTLYIMGDEKYIHEQFRKIINNSEDEDKKKQIMSKCFVCFSGISQKGKRRKLNDRFVFLTKSKSPWNDFLDAVTSVYDFEKIKKIVFLSDAGSWLLSGAPDLKMYPHNKIILCLCEFHVRQKINRITTNQDYRDKLNEFIDSNDKKGFKNFMLKIKDEKKSDSKRLETLNKYENYIVKHWKKIQNMFASPCRSSMESHISHFVASYFSSRPKAYSDDTIEKLLKLQEYKLNGINLTNLYLTSYKNNEIITIKKEDLDFSIFESNSSSNIPIIETGINFSLYSLLTSIAH